MRKIKARKARTSYKQMYIPDLKFNEHTKFADQLQRENQSVFYFILVDYNISAANNLQNKPPPPPPPQKKKKRFQNCVKRSEVMSGTSFKSQWFFRTVVSI